MRLRAFASLRYTQNVSLLPPQLERVEVKPRFALFGAQFTEEHDLVTIGGHGEFVFRVLPVGVAGEGMFARFLLGLAKAGAHTLLGRVRRQRNDSADPRELTTAIGWGAVGATCNPVIALAAIKSDLATWRPRIARACWASRSLRSPSVSHSIALRKASNGTFASTGRMPRSGRRTTMSGRLPDWVASCSLKSTFFCIPESSTSRRRWISPQRPRIDYRGVARHDRQ